MYHSTSYPGFRRARCYPGGGLDVSLDKVVFQPSLQESEVPLDHRVLFLQSSQIQLDRLNQPHPIIKHRLICLQRSSEYIKHGNYDTETERDSMIDQLRCLYQFSGPAIDMYTPIRYLMLMGSIKFSIHFRVRQVM